jgi:hypothetical protein
MQRLSIPSVFRVDTFELSNRRTSREGTLRVALPPLKALQRTLTRAKLASVWMGCSGF